MLPLLNEARVHPDVFPGVPVEILEGVAVHEAVVGRRSEGGAARRQGLADDFIDLQPAFAGEAGQDFRALRRIADFQWREPLGTSHASAAWRRYPR